MLQYRQCECKCLAGTRFSCTNAVFASQYAGYTTFLDRCWTSYTCEQVIEKNIKNFPLLNVLFSEKGNSCLYFFQTWLRSISIHLQRLLLKCIEMRRKIINPFCSRVGLAPDSIYKTHL